MAKNVFSVLNRNVHVPGWAAFQGKSRSCAGTNNFPFFYVNVFICLHNLYRTPHTVKAPRTTITQPPSYQIFQY